MATINQYTPYEKLLYDILATGQHREDRTATGTTSKFGCRMEFDLSNGKFPLITTKRMYLKGIIYELLWFLRGDTNIKYLNDHGVHIWDEWADENGDLGPVYGAQWRHWKDDFDDNHRYVDQIGLIMDQIRNDPYSRRIILSAWNVGELYKMALPPCHMMCQFYVEPYEDVPSWIGSDVPKGRLSCQLYQRSADMFLGVPFNIAEYSLLTMMIAQQTDLEPGRFIWVGGDCHIYDNHREQVIDQLHRLPYEWPRVYIKKAKDIFSYEYEDFHLENYQCHPAIKAPVAV